MMTRAFISIPEGMKGRGIKRAKGESFKRDGDGDSQSEKYMNYLAEHFIHQLTMVIPALMSYSSGHRRHQ
jgi:hypothetical protein